MDNILTMYANMFFLVFLLQMAGVCEAFMCSVDQRILTLSEPLILQLCDSEFSSCWDCSKVKGQFEIMKSLSVMFSHVAVSQMLTLLRGKLSFTCPGFVYICSHVVRNIL